MAELGFQLEGTFTELKSDFDLLPHGDYAVMIVSSEHKISVSGNRYIGMTYELIDGEYAGRKIFATLMLEHAKEDVVKRAMDTMQNIASFIGVDKFTDTEQLHGKPFMITVGTEKGKNGYADKSVARAYMAANNVAQIPNATPAAPPEAPKAPWAA